MKTRVLVIDDEPDLLRALRINFRARDYDVTTAADGSEGLRLAAEINPDVVILDLGLPDLDGLEVLAGLRGWTDVPVLVLSGRDGGPTKVAALDAGADDYVTKPFSMDEVLARMRALIRRHAASSARIPTAIVTFGQVTVDLAAHQISRIDPADPAGRPSPVHLTPTEWHLLEVLLAHPGKLLSARMLLTEVWGSAYANQPANLRLYVAQLRRKLEPDVTRPRYILNEPGMGYRFQPEGE